MATNRFNHARAETFAAYTITAAVEQAQRSGMPFVRLARADIAAGCGGERLRDTHIEVIRSHLGRFGYGMANLGTEFVFFNGGTIEDSTYRPELEDLNAMTDRFARLVGSEAADELWEEVCAEPLG